MPNMISTLLLIARWIGQAHARWGEAMARPRLLSAQVDALRERLEKLRPENELLRARLSRLDSHHRPMYRSWERLAILAHAAPLCHAIGYRAQRPQLAPGCLTGWPIRSYPSAAANLVSADTNGPNDVFLAGPLY